MSKLEYIWLDVNNELRSKTKYVKNVDVNNLPIWNFDGSSTGQAEGSQSEVLLKPCKCWKDPFRKESLSAISIIWYCVKLIIWTIHLTIQIHVI